MPDQRGRLRELPPSVLVSITPMPWRYAPRLYFNGPLQAGLERVVVLVAVHHVAESRVNLEKQREGFQVTVRLRRKMHAKQSPIDFVPNTHAECARQSATYDSWLQATFFTLPPTRRRARIDCSC